MARDGTVRVVAYLRPELAAKIAVRAAAERRTISGMVGVLLDVGSVVISVNPVQRVKESKGGMCEHRVPAGSFCKRCG